MRGSELQVRKRGSTANSTHRTGWSTSTESVERQTLARFPRSKSQHNRARCGVEGCRRRGIGPNHSGMETIGDASPSDSKHKTVHSPTAQASPLSGGCRVSRKRVQHPHNMPTALKRAVILESAAGAVTIPEIEGEKSPVKQDSSVKIEVQLSL